MGVKGKIHSIESFGTLDGPGVRYVLFLQGCALRCIYCHNPDTWNTCNGKEVDSEDIVKDVLSYRNFIISGGLTLSGGEPLLQSEFALDILKRCKDYGIHTALDTAGTVPISISKEVLDVADLILLDIKSIDESLYKEITGCSIENTLLTLDYCEKIKKPVWIRHVLLPQYTTDISSLNELALYLSKFSCIELVELLPFHKMGEYKWDELGYSYTLKDIKEPTTDEIQKAKDILESDNLDCLVKGKD